jgi:nicotinate-nucleotide adenylyltransferase
VGIAAAAQKACNLERVIFLPCWQSPHKIDRQLAPAEHRVAMLELATEGLPWAEVSTWEIEREQTSYSWQSAEHFADTSPNAELFWILGTDQWQALPTWSEPAKLAKLLQFIVFPRGDEAEPISDFRHTELDVRHPASSTEIRRRVSKDEPTENLLAPQVAAYIRSHRLYP